MRDFGHLKARVRILSSMWLSVLGLAGITVGVCLILLPAGIIVGGFCALLLDHGIDGQMKGGKT